MQLIVKLVFVLSHSRLIAYVQIEIVEGLNWTLASLIEVLGHEFGLRHTVQMLRFPYLKGAYLIRFDALISSVALVNVLSVDQRFYDANHRVIEPW